jgi:NAD(P)-dependent dehydrogenase (short-subunit alcohol dehydrogenase family)
MINPQGTTISVVTGATSGIGKETASNLLRAGHRVILACRNQRVGDATAAQLTRECIIADTFAKCVELDLSNMQSVRSFGDRLAKEFPAVLEEGIHNLINNAGKGWGTQTTERILTRDGYESFFQVNYLGHFALTFTLLPYLLRGGQNTGVNSRIINVSSSLHDPEGRGNRNTKVDLQFNDLNAREEVPFQPKSAYCRSKLAQIMFTYALQNKFRHYRLPVICSCLNPGFIPSTNLIRDSGMMGKLFLRYCLDGILKICCSVTRSVEDGGVCVYLVTTAEECGEGGQYFEYLRSKSLNVHSSSTDSYNENMQTELFNKSWALIATHGVNSPDWSKWEQKYGDDGGTDNLQ